MKPINLDSFPSLPKMTVEDIKMLLIYQTLKQNNWKRGITAEQLKISRSGLFNHMRKMHCKDISINRS